MSLLLRAAVLGGLAYLITRSMSGNPAQRGSERSGRRASPVRELHPGENIWPTSESQQSAAANAGPGS